MDDCDSVPKLRSEDLWDRACRFDIKDLGADCVKQQSFGYEDGQPCILLKMNRVCDIMRSRSFHYKNTSKEFQYWVDAVLFCMQM